MTCLTFFTIAIRHVTARASWYLSVLVSNTFAILLTYLFGALLEQQEFQTGLPGRYLSIAVWVVAVFAVLFMAQATAMFLEARRQDLAVLSLLGMSPASTALTLHAENLLVAVTGLLAGLVLGAVLSRLFALSVSVLLGLTPPAGTLISIAAAIRSLIVFAAGVLATAAWTHLAVWRPPLLRWLQRGALPDPAVGPVRPGLLGCIGALLAAYGLHFAPADAAWVRPLVFVLFAAGVYLFFRAVAPLVMRRLALRRGTGLWLVALAQLSGRLRQTARSLTVATLLISLVLALLMTTQNRRRVAESGGADRVGLQVVGEPRGVGPDRTRSILAMYGQFVGMEAHVDALSATLGWPARIRSGGLPEQALVLSRSSLRHWAETLLGARTDHLTQNTAVLLLRDPLADGPGPFWVAAGFGENRADLPVSPIHGLGRYFNAHPLTRAALVVDDATFADWQARFGAAHGTRLHGYVLSEWQESAPAVELVESWMGIWSPAIRMAAEPTPVSARVWTSRAEAQEMGYLFFLLSFGGLLVLLAAGSLLQLQLFLGLASDRHRMQTLRNLGMAREEAERLLSTQVAAVFWLPALLGAGHALLFAHLYGQALPRGLDMALISGGYLMLHGIYYLVCRKAYTRALLGPAPPEEEPDTLGPAAPIAGPGRVPLQRLGGLCGMLGGLALLIFVPLAAWFEQAFRHDRGEFVLRITLIAAALLFVVALLALAQRLRGILSSMVVYPAVCGAALVFMGNLPPFDVWGVWILGAFLVGAGLFTVGLHDLLTRAGRLPLRGAVPLVIGTFPVPVMIMGEALGHWAWVPLGVFASGWIWIGAAMWRDAGARSISISKMQG